MSSRSLSFSADTSAASFQIGNILAILIITALLAGVITAAGGHIQTESEDATEKYLTVTGENLATELTTADSLANNGSISSLYVEVDIPAQINGSSYIISLENDPREGTSIVQLETSAPSITITVPFSHTLPIEETALNSNSGTVIITLTENNELTIKDR